MNTKNASNNHSNLPSSNLQNTTNPDYPSPLALTNDINAAEAGVIILDTSVVVSSAGIIPGHRTPMKLLDERGAEKGCSSFANDVKELVIGRDEGVFSYSVEDRGGAAGFEGTKQCISTVGRYVLVASIDDKTKRTNITVYDLRNKFIGMNSPLPVGEKVVMVLNDGSIAYVVTSNWTLIRFREKDTSAKIEVSFSYFSIGASLI
jgi:hypothetical protein